ncbi:MAG: hypothetical protein ABL900_09130 [Burkholderiaceae bacterium]
MSIVHAAAQLCRASAGHAFTLLTEASGLARWNLGLRNAREAGAGLLTGESLFGGGSAWVRVHADAARGVVDYAVGADPGSLEPRIQARVQPGIELGHPADTCIVTLLAWRTPQMDDARWQRLQAAHDVEIDLIRAQLEMPAPRGDAA